MGLLLFSLSILPPYVLYPSLKASIRPLRTRHCMTTTFLEQGLAEKNWGVFVQREMFSLLVPLSLHVFEHTQDPCSSSLCPVCLTKRETSHTVFGFLLFVVLLILNLVFCFFIYLFFSGAVLNFPVSLSIIFLCITLYQLYISIYTSYIYIQFSNRKEKSSMLANSVCYPLFCPLHVEAF